MWYIKFGQDNPSSFREETENILMLMHDDGQKRIAKDDSGYLQKKTFLRWAIHFVLFKLNNHTICTLFTVCWAMLCRLFSAFFFICVLVTKGILRLHLRHTCWYKVKDKYRYWNSRANGLPKTIQCIQFYSLQVQGQKSRPLYFFILIFCWFCYNIRTFINFI